MLHGSINHVSITVSDLREAMRFFGPFLGFLGYTVGAIEHDPRSRHDLSVNLNQANGTAFNVWQRCHDDFSRCTTGSPRCVNSRASAGRSSASFVSELVPRSRRNPESSRWARGTTHLLRGPDREIEWSTCRGGARAGRAACALEIRVGMSERTPRRSVMQRAWATSRVTRSLPTARSESQRVGPPVRSSGELHPRHSQSRNSSAARPKARVRALISAWASRRRVARRRVPDRCRAALPSCAQPPQASRSPPPCVACWYGDFRCDHGCPRGLALAVDPNLAGASSAGRGRNLRRRGRGLHLIRRREQSGEAARGTRDDCDRDRAKRTVPRSAACREESGAWESCIELADSIEPEN